ncbi:MAG: tRNA dimethylallyltransferase [Bacteroidia bacterium]|nr:MAG: tRNA dimethylallyltransferase [Bacteroidia bacterium]
MKNPFLLVIGGPTGAGKTQLAIELYLRWGWPIISADSRQVYRYLDIGTNKVSQAIQAQVPHFLIDICCPEELFSAGRFVEKVEALISAWGDVPVVQVVGGTGFYQQALLHGLDPIPPIPIAVRAEVEAWLRKEGVEAVVAWLLREDPLTASQIDLRNPRRVQRAVEVLQATGRPWASYWQGQKERRYPAYVVVLSAPRDLLYARIGRRTQEQVAQGWLEETEYVLAKGYTPEAPGLQTLGYKECLEVLRGARARTTLVEAIVQANRAYARRQLTWWRGHTYDAWVEVEGPLPVENVSEAVWRQMGV